MIVLRAHVNVFTLTSHRERGHPVTCRNSGRSKTGTHFPFFFFKDGGCLLALRLLFCTETVVDYVCEGFFFFSFPSFRKFLQDSDEGSDDDDSKLLKRRSKTKEEKVRSCSVVLHNA